MEHLQTRLDALEQQMDIMHRQLRWWRGLAGGLLVLAGLTWVLPSGTTQEEPRSTARLAALEPMLQHLTMAANGDGRPEVVITGANLRIVNGAGATSTRNGLGNLIVGYNEPRGSEPDVRTGSHNVVVGKQHNFSRFGGLVVGSTNTVSGDFAAVIGGSQNTASGEGAVVSGGHFNTASGVTASVSGGFGNTARGEGAAVSGGRHRTAAGEADWVAGPLLADE